MLTSVPVRPRLLALLALAAACAPEHQVQGRPYQLTAPKGWDGTTPLPLVVLLHGYGSSGLVQDFVFPLSAAVDAQGFLYAQPSGTLDSAGRRFWNATDACCNFDDLAVDDVGFLKALVADVKAHQAVDASRVMLVGHSNGAFMALRMACEGADAVTAVVAVAGSTWKDPARCPDGPRLPVLLLHGTADQTIPYAGKPDATPGYPGAEATADRFAAREGCGGPRAEVERLDLTGDATAETHREVYPGCPRDAQVELWRMEGVGHIPTFNAAWAPRLLGFLAEHRR